MARRRPRPRGPRRARRRRRRMPRAATAAGRCCSRTRSSCGGAAGSRSEARGCWSGANGRQPRPAPAPAATLWRGGGEVGAPGSDSASGSGSGRFFGELGGSGRMHRARIKSDQKFQCSTVDHCYVPDRLISFRKGDVRTVVSAYICTVTK